MNGKVRDAAIVFVVMAALTAAAQSALFAAFGTGALVGAGTGGALMFMADMWGSAVRRKYERRGE